MGAPGEQASGGAGVCGDVVGSEEGCWDVGAGGWTAGAGS